MATATFEVLGTRHFVLNQQKSQFQVLISGNISVIRAPFKGQTDGVVGPAFIDLEAGKPDPITGVATVNVTNTSEYFFADGSPFLVLCIKPQRQVQSAGLVGCNGGFNFSTVLTINHKLGRVGEDITVDQCTAMDGTVESPNQICAAGQLGETCRLNADCDTTTGSGDGVCGLAPATCTAPEATLGNECRADAECDTGENTLDGVCGIPAPHPGVCNGMFMASQLSGDTGGAGEVILAPFQIGGLTLNGLPVTIAMEKALPCGDEPSFPSPFALSTGTFKTVILNTNAQDDGTHPPRTFQTTGQDFDCHNWQDSSGPGRFVLSAPILDVPMVGDIITVFTLDGSASSTPTPTATVPTTATPTPTP